MSDLPDPHWSRGEAVGILAAVLIGLATLSDIPIGAPEPASFPSCITERR